MKVDPYKNIAKFYDRLFEPLNRGLRALGMKMLPPEEGMQILDVGCGTGIHLQLYQRAGCIISGIDLSPSMLLVARNRLGDSANLCLGDASKMPYQDKRFDLIIMSTVLHEMPPGVRDAVIDESKRTCKQDGRILLIDFHPGPIQPLKGWINKTIILMAEIAAGRKHFKNYRDFINRQGLASLISTHRLLVVQEKIVAGGNVVLYLLSL
ncbi:MAG: methyltransferase domain-containing protein [Candidatus Aminicenantes bacterium]|nr:MAG: methyltransferase domain-containing protein [Candidatus Aminicenantes bacterium]